MFKITPEKMINGGFVMCEHSKLWGRKEDMVSKIIITQHFFYEKETVYYSPAFAPDWDVKEITATGTRYLKNQPPKEIKLNKNETH